MTEQRADAETRVAAEASAGDSPKPRKPFVIPTVQDLGGLTALTLLGGSL
jgi:hypothetical protein